MINSTKRKLIAIKVSTCWFRLCTHLQSKARSRLHKVQSFKQNKKLELKKLEVLGVNNNHFAVKLFSPFSISYSAVHDYYLLPATTTLFSILIYSKQPSCQWLHLLLSSSKPVLLSPTISKSVIVLKYVPTSTSKGEHFVEIFPGHYICF